MSTELGTISLSRVPQGKEVGRHHERPDIRSEVSSRSNSRSRAVSTERTILSPFTKEYRVLAANSGIRQFLEEFLFGELLKVRLKFRFPTTAHKNGVVF
ncbi:hypothetical protein CJ030_MR5G010380 [Morella rubra]|uniref:Uncharacterized protein n=1 Tax=Morella rubra TaxID=262757 RepID=A0A6A1VV19_9ROSI|nr:hypothetical protein CJ030_MR5G010380 [Morella rubra]